MSGAALKVMPSELLRVAVVATNTLQRGALTNLIKESGHSVVTMQDAPDVVLADEDGALSESLPTVLLGGGPSGQLGLLSRSASPRQIDAALRAVAVGLIVRSATTKEPYFAPLIDGDAHALLTPREVEVLGAIADGLTNKAIARRFDISLHTVKFHIESLFRKLGARTRTEALAKGSERRHDRSLRCNYDHSSEKIYSLSDSQNDRLWNVRRGAPGSRLLGRNWIGSRESIFYRLVERPFAAYALGRIVDFRDELLGSSLRFRLRHFYLT